MYLTELWEGRNQIRKRIKMPNIWEVVGIHESLSSFGRWAMPLSFRICGSISMAHMPPFFATVCLEGRLSFPGLRNLICLLRNQGFPSQRQAQSTGRIGTVPCPPLSPLKVVTLPNRLCRKSFSAVTLERKGEHKMLTGCPHAVPNLWLHVLQKVAQTLPTPRVKSEPACVIQKPQGGGGEGRKT